MSTICHGFIENAWRKDLCSNCFRTKEEHLALAAAASKMYQTSSSSNYSQNNWRNSHVSNNTGNNNNGSNSVSINVRHHQNGLPPPPNNYQHPQNPSSNYQHQSSNNNYQSSSSNNNNYSSSGIPRGKYGQGQQGHTPRSSLYSCYETPNRERVNVTVNNNNGSGDVQRKQPPPRNHYYDDNSANFRGGNTSNGGVSVSVGRSSSYNQLNTVGRTTTTNPQGIISQSNQNYNNSSSSGQNGSGGMSNGTGLTHRRIVAGGGGNIRSSGGNAVVTSSTGMNGTVAVVTNGSGTGNSIPVPSVRLPAKNHQVHVGSAPSQNRIHSSSSGGRMTDFPDGEVQVTAAGRRLLPDPGKGILRKVEKGRRRKMSVTFPKEVVAVIGYGGESSEDESDDDLVPDPLDAVTVAEIMARNSQSPLEKEINRQTLKNTSFNSIKTNLLGFTSIEIDGIIGCTGGTSLQSGGSKPLVSIGTFEARKEPLRITRKLGEDDDYLPPKNTAAPIRQITNNNNKINARNMVNMSQRPETTKNKVSTPSVLKTSNNNFNSASNTNGSAVSVNVVNSYVNPQSKSASTGSGGAPASASAKYPENLQPKTIQKVTTPTTTEYGQSQVPPLPSPRSSIPAVTASKEVDANSQPESTNNRDRTQSEPLSNLIILNDGNIASKRISFLKDILREDALNAHLDAEEFYSQSQPLDSLEPTILSQVLLKSEVNLEIQPSPRPVEEPEFTRNPNDLFDDSLEDSGLDIGTAKSSTTEPRISSSTSSSQTESDTEKSGSNSDSGNENDFERDRERIQPKPKGRTTDGNGLLRIACDLNEEDLPASTALSPAKLSPDSVIYSSELSELSNSGSSESIPSVIVQESEAVPPPNSKASTTGPPIPPILKRLAPPPPRMSAPSVPAPNQEPPRAPPIQPRQSIYANEELYDDVSARDNHPNSRRSSNEESPENSTMDEDLYDDCSAMGAHGPGNGKVVTGSYDFTDTNEGEAHSGLDRPPIRQNDGIEFIGIRKIDSETFLKQKTPPPQASPVKDKEKGSSPRVKRKVNQFFSTIGKRAGAAFNRNHNTIDDSATSKFSEKSSPNTSSSFSPFSYYKRSMSQDEMSMTRTQEIYATLSPTVLKARGGSGVLSKLSKIDLQYGSGSKEDDSKEKSTKNKSKFSTSLKKFLRFGPKDGENKYDFDGSASKPQEQGSTGNSFPVPPKTEPRRDSSGGRMPMPEPPVIPSDAWKQSVPPARPPPPPPRVHSLDLLNKADDSMSTHAMQMQGTVKPARPPPPVRFNNGNNAPNFVSVFSGQGHEQDFEDEGQNQARSSHYSQGQGHTYNPPNKPRRKASMRNGDCYGDGGAYTANYLETTYNHITSLNFETLKLIASQTPARIRRNSNQLQKFSKSPLRWSQFYVTDVEPICQGRGFCFYSAFWEDEACILFIQESLCCGIPPIEFDCLEASVSFEDVVPTQFVTWEASDYVNTGNGVKAFVSVLPSCTVQKLPGYLSNGSVTPSRKYFALLQAMDYWGTEEISDLLVFHQIPPTSNTSDSGALSSKSKIQIPNFGLVYVASARLKSGSFISQHSSRANFELALKQLLFASHQQGQPSHHLLGDNDRHILLRRICGSSEEVEAQLRLFFQLKLFGPQAGDLDKILRYRSDKQVTQWMDKERAFCMKDAIERTLQRNSEAISPLRKSFVEFLMMSDNCAKSVLDLVVDLNPDL